MTDCIKNQQKKKRFFAPNQKRGKKKNNNKKSIENNFSRNEWSKGQHIFKQGQYDFHIIVNHYETPHQNQ